MSRTMPDLPACTPPITRQLAPSLILPVDFAFILRSPRGLWCGHPGRNLQAGRLHHKFTGAARKDICRAGAIVPPIPSVFGDSTMSLAAIPRIAVWTFAGLVAF